MRARERSEALLLTLADGRGRKAKAARCARALIRRFAPPSPASQEKGWDCWTFRCEGKTGLATEPRSHKKLPGHRILSLMPDTHPEAIAPPPPPPLIRWPLLALFFHLRQIGKAPGLTPITHAPILCRPFHGNKKQPSN